MCTFSAIIALPEGLVLPITPLLEGSLTHSTFVNVLALLNFSQRSPDSFVTKLDPKTWVSASVGFQLGEFQFLVNGIFQCHSLLLFPSPSRFFKTLHGVKFATLS